jgi:uncharacterized protein YjiS (DUF1127 family)
MWSIAHAPSLDPRGRISIAGGIWRLTFVLVRILDLALVVQRERRLLMSLDDRMLRDVGLSRCDASVEAHRSPWDIPRDRLWF